MTLRSIHLVNIQSHRDNVFEFPETGIIRFSGNNSAGKSAVFKPLLYLLQGGIHSPKTRAGLVTRTCTYGEATYVRYDDVALTIHIALEAAATWVSIAKPGLEPVKRYLADKNYKEIAYAFGLHYSPNRDLSLNYASGDGPIMFFTTQHCANGELVDMALTDGPASTALQNFDFTLKQAQEIREKAINNIPTLEETVASITTYDEDKLLTKQEKLISFLNVLSAIYIPTIPEIHAVPSVNTVEVYQPKLPTLHYPKVYNVTCNIVDIRQEARDLMEIKEGKCPTCGRRLVDVS